MSHASGERNTCSGCLGLTYTGYVPAYVTGFSHHNEARKCPRGLGKLPKSSKPVYKPYDEKTGIIYWDIPFRAGELRAEGCDKEGNALSSYSIRTSGRPYAIRATADRTILSGDRATAHITVEVVDEEGTVVKLGDNEITCTVEGGSEREYLFKEVQYIL